MFSPVGQGDERKAASWALAVCALLVLASVGVTGWTGIPEFGPASGHDADPARLFLAGFQAGMETGAWWPRWLHEGNRGFGSPAFLFYPPLSYWAAAAVQRLLDTDLDSALLVSAAGWRLAASALVYVWLRSATGVVPAVIGTLLFALNPYTMLINPLVRFAYAEMAGTFFVALCLLAAGTRRPLLWMTPAFALLVLTHLPTAVIAGGMLPAWAFVTAAGWREGVRRMALALAGCGLGTALAAAYLLPALLLMSEVNAEAWQMAGGRPRWTGAFLFAWPAAGRFAAAHFALMHLGLLIALASVCLAAWIGRRPAAPLADCRFVRGVALLACICLLMTPLAWPAWAMLPPLQRIQFPWRLLVVLVPIGAALVAWRLQQLDGGAARRGRSLAMACVAVLCATWLWIPFSALLARSPGLDPHALTRLVFAAPGPRHLPDWQPPEYVTREAGAAGWDHRSPSGDVPLREALRAAAAATPSLSVTRGPEGGLLVRGEAERPISVLLPQFAFPGWAVTGHPATAALATDATTGLLRIDIPEGVAHLAVQRVPTEPEHLGWWVSAAALLAWLGIAALGARRRTELSSTDSI
jgi:hypothetical protein